MNQSTSPFQPIYQYFAQLNYPLPLKRKTLQTVCDINKPMKYSFNEMFEANLGALQELFEKVLLTVMNTIEKIVDKCSFYKSLEPARKDIEQSLTNNYGYDFRNMPFPGTSKQEVYDIIDDILMLANSIKIKLLQIFQLPEPGNMNAAISKALQKLTQKNKVSNIGQSDQQFLLDQNEILYMKGITNIFEQVIYEKQANQENSKQKKISDEFIIDRALDRQKNMQNKQVTQQQSVSKPGKLKKFFQKFCGKEDNKAERPPSQIKKKLSILSEKFKPLEQAHRSTLLTILNNVQIKMPLNITQRSFIQHLRFSKNYKISKLAANNWVEAVQKTIKLQENRLYFQYNDSQIKQLMKKIAQIQREKQVPSDIDQQYNEYTIIIGQSFIVFQQKYDPVRRRFLKSMIKFMLQKLYNKINLFSVLRNVQNDHLRKFPDSPLLQALRQNKINPQQVTEIIKQQMEIIKQTIPQPLQQSFDILRFSKSGQHNKIINLIISGFLSQDVDKQAQYADLVKMMNQSEIYGIRWASKGVNNMFQWMFSVGQNIVKKSNEQKQAAGPHVRAANLLARFKNSIDDNPFKYAFQVAIVTGYYLAEFLIRNFQGYQINIVTYSLGAELVKCILKRLSQAKRLYIINQVVILGGVADVEQFSNLLKNAEYPIKIINFHSKNDSVLRYLLRQSKPQIKPVGLNQIKNPTNLKFKHVVINQNCSNFIWSHLIYRSRLTIIGNLIDARTD